MRPFIIVTVKDEDKRLNYDMELPTDVPLSQLSEDIVEALNIYNREHTLPKGGYSLYCVRLQQTLPASGTLGELGVWTGDVLILK